MPDSNPPQCSGATHDDFFSLVTLRALCRIEIRRNARGLLDDFLVFLELYAGQLFAITLGGYSVQNLK
jgi:hypothetical protein